ncbi:MAG TPA: glycoside hydrolase family 43 protein [Dictyoglomaceae bacterium]|nr:glycoside hydrolase family 43 protein [Dictyoglomaceae bacterium]HOL39309.1 glycoside hydrolase family 43 protein [Dictyoglomaceae bacterium]HOP95038.1 glycoside hydrolase family 43 protein [Dictyoglomaceae bacterium]HPP16009.1 glycoside hydrolase family 43 protein [Dictyoglomaceae bacterium]HPU42970.1 glycoside hydrolase family 43 protein [Dictyoglomaceae bacterium]
MKQLVILMILLVLLTSITLSDTDVMPFQAWASVHDPAITKAGDFYYVFGSHLAVAKAKDLMVWQTVNSSLNDDNKIIPNISVELSEAFEWAETPNPDVWAPSVIQLSDGKYYMYYCVSTFGAFRSTIGIAVSDNIEGPYKNVKLILKSGIRFEEGLAPDGTMYDPQKHPNCIDPHVFYDKEGNLWMSYGSYFGGIYIVKLDPKTGFPLPNQGYGKKLAGGYHAPMEGSFILYSPETDYYYLFLSFGGLDSKGGYNIRVARSKNPDGPYLDTEGKSMVDASGRDRTKLSEYGAKLIGNFNLNKNNARSVLTFGYVSPGHNSAYYDPETGKYFIVFHTRFPGRGEYFTMRVHQMFLNSDGWPVVAPFPYAGESISKLNINDVAGDYFLINHGKDITADIKTPLDISLKADGTISGEATGKWELKDQYLTLEINSNGNTEVYKGIVLSQWDPVSVKKVVTFSCLSKRGVSVWGVQKTK